VTFPAGKPEGKKVALMENITAALATAQHPPFVSAHQAKPLPHNLRTDQKGDSFQLTGSFSSENSLNVVLERSYAQLRAIVGQARDDLNVPQGVSLDLSAEATANRIADFALGAFERFLANHEELGENEARQVFVDLVGGAINQGIEEAREILGTFDALTPEVGAKIDTVSGIIQQRLDSFLGNE
jgi:hypothetical protein